ncbi:MAG: 30S ribosomal protein S20 [Pirellulaceae bacterium]
MPNTKSASKRLRQNVVRRQHNRAVKSALRSQLRKVREAVTAGDHEKAELEARVAVKRLDKAGAKRVIHPKTADRLKSRLSARLKKAKTAA